MKFSIIEKNHKVLRSTELEEIVRITKTGEYNKINIKSLIDKLRNPDTVNKSEIKSKLPAFTPAGEFDTKRNNESLNIYSQVIGLDYDKLGSELEKARIKIEADPYTLMVFKSPSGNGLKVFTKVNTKEADHKDAFIKVASYYNELTGIESDPSVKDLARQCYFSYDPSVFSNNESKVFLVKLKANPDFDSIIDFTNQVSSYEEGNRNNYIHQLACNCNRFGLEMELVSELILRNFEHESDQELISTIQSAYDNNPTEFGTSDSKFIKGTAASAESAVLSKWQSTPFLLDEIQNDLPDFLKDCLKLNSTKREQDVFFISALTALSGCLQDVTGQYRGKYYNPNLFLFVTAPPASGKGALGKAKSLISKIHESKLEESKIAKAKYKIDVKNCGKSINCKEKLVEPKLSLLVVPADSSSAAIVMALDNNEGNLIMYETEADTLVNTLKKDWAGYDDMLRKAFEHESISILRKGEEEHIEVSTPKLATAISGTPEQLKKLINSPENGLFSRFIYYGFASQRKWDNPFSTDRADSTELLEVLKETASEIHEFNYVYPFELVLNEDQINEHESFFTKHFEGKLSDEYESGVIARMGLIAFRIMMILTAIRRFENGQVDSEIVCDDIDFMIAMNLVEKFIVHSKTILSFIRNSKILTTEEQFYIKLPDSFKKSDADKIGDSFNIKSRTVFDRLNKLVAEGQLENPKKGYYQKLTKKQECQSC